MTDSAAAIAKARTLLAPAAPTRSSALGALMAASLAATAAVAMAGVVVLGTGVSFDEAPAVSAR